MREDYTTFGSPRGEGIAEFSFYAAIVSISVGPRIYASFLVVLTPQDTELNPTETEIGARTWY